MRQFEVCMAFKYLFCRHLQNVSFRKVQMKNENCHVLFLGIKIIATPLTVLLHQFKKAKYRLGVMRVSRAFLKCLQKFPFVKIFTI